MKAAVPFILFMSLAASGSFDPADHPLFAEDEVQEIRLTFDDPDFWEDLERNYGTETYLSASFQWEGYEFESVGVRIKGSASVFGNSTMKKSLKIDLDLYDASQSIDGIRKINLNCNFNDPSFVREAAAYEIASEAGLTCPRTTFAALYINGTYWGLYTLVEQYDSRFIEERFGEGEDGNLWKGDDHGSLEFFGWDVSLYYDDYELKTNELANEWAALVEYCYHLNNSDESQLPEVLSEVMDVNSALLLLAMDNVSVNLDSYTGRCVNYYLYHADRDSRFVFSQWDMNESWGVYNSWNYSSTRLQQLDPYWTNPSAGEYRPLAEILWSVDEYRDVYVGHIQRMLATTAHPTVLVPRMEEMRDLIRDWVYMEEEPRRLFSSSEFEKAMYQNVEIAPDRYAPALQGFIENRYDYLTSELGTWDPVETLILNEVSAGSDSCSSCDWIELVNTGTGEMLLSGFYLTDDMAYPRKWAFPDTVILPGEYLILQADSITAEVSLNTGFPLAGNGGEVYLMQGAVIVDRVTYPALDDTVSWGRWTDLEETWAVQPYPTPGAPNSDEDPQQWQEPEPVALAVYSANPVYAGTTAITLTGNSGTAELTIYDMSGRVIATPFHTELSGEQVVHVNISAWPAGVYIARLLQGTDSCSQLVTVIR